MRHFFFITVAIIFCVSCSQQNQEQNQEQSQDNLPLEQTSYQNDHTFTNEEIASHLATVASEVPNVNDAAAIVAGPYTVVGIDIDEKTKRERVGTIKYSVTEALQHDPYGRTAVVIADADIMTRIQEMGNQLRDGHPVKGVVDELATIVSRYMPTFPVNENDRQTNEQESLPENELEEDNQ